MPQVVEVTSPRGIKAWLVEDHKLPLLSVSFAFKGGVEQDPPDKQGLAMLAASLLTQGAGPYDDRAFQDRLAARSIQMEIGASRDHILGKVKSLTRAQDEAFRLLSLALTKPRFDPTTFTRLRQVQLAGIKAQRASPAWQGRYALLTHLYGEHPYGYRSLGTPESLARLSPAQAQAFLRPRLAKDNLHVAVVGAITPAQLAKALDTAFGALPEHATLSKIEEATLPQTTRSILIRREGTQTDMLFAAPMLRRADPDWYAAEIANYILGDGGFTSRLMKAVRAKEGLTYGVSTGLSSMDHASLLIGNLSSNNDKVAQAVALVKDVWAELYAKGITQAEIDAARDYLVGSMAIALTSTDAIAGTLLSMQLEGLGRDYLDRREDLLRAVTAADVARVIARWFDPAKASFSFVGTPEGLTVDETRDPVKE